MIKFYSEMNVRFNKIKNISKSFKINKKYKYIFLNFNFNK